jgi:hypothetical protein
MKHQIGTYAFRINRRQLDALVGALRRSEFATLRHPEPIVIDTPLYAVMLSCQGKSRSVTFPMHDKPIPPEFKKLWDELVGVLDQCEFEPKKALGLSLRIDKEGRRGAPLPITLEMKNLGKGDLVIPNPLSGENDATLIARVRARRIGPGGKPARKDEQTARLKFGPEKNAAANRQLRPSETLRLRDTQALRLTQPGEYAIRAHLKLLAPEPDELRHRGNYVWGWVFSNECRASIR